MEIYYLIHVQIKIHRGYIFLDSCSDGDIRDIFFYSCSDGDIFLDSCSDGVISWIYIP